MKLKVKFRQFISVIFNVYLTAHAFVDAQNFRREKQGLSFAKFVKAASVKLDVIKLASLKVSKLGECLLKCTNHQECYSVNFGRLLDKEHTCELLETDKFRQASKLVASGEDFDHYHVKVSKRQPV